MKNSFLNVIQRKSLENWQKKLSHYNVTAEQKTLCPTFHDFGNKNKLYLTNSLFTWNPKSSIFNWSISGWGFKTSLSSCGFISSRVRSKGSNLTLFRLWKYFFSWKIIVPNLPILFALQQSVLCVRQFFTNTVKQFYTSLYKFSCYPLLLLINSFFQSY